MSADRIQCKQCGNTDSKYMTITGDNKFAYCSICHALTPLWDKKIDVTINDDGAEKLIGNAETYIRLGDYKKANEYYQKAVNEYAGDYRGWWGLIICATNGLSIVASNQKEVEQWFQNMKTLLQLQRKLDIYSNIKEKYKQYLQLVAQKEARQKINELDKKKEAVEKAKSDYEIIKSDQDNRLKSNRGKILERKLYVDVRGRIIIAIILSVIAIVIGVEAHKAYLSFIAHKQVGLRVDTGYVFLYFLTILFGIISLVMFCKSIEINVIGSTDEEKMAVEEQEKKLLELFSVEHDEWSRKIAILEQDVVKTQQDILQIQENTRHNQTMINYDALAQGIYIMKMQKL